MPDAFLKLPAADRREALAVAAAGGGRPIHLLDKDVWLVWLLDVLFQWHWHDLVRLDRAGRASAAIADRALAFAVAKHKSMFFSENDSVGDLIDYVAAVSGGLRLVPGGKALNSLSLNYARMLDDGLLPGDAEPFETLLEQCRDLLARANKTK
ncbi:MAG: hypothetical protein K2X35_04750 [Bryobacteraceae bacterium]|nr:hypothetical protein [Bryobacteraceae bacterium]